MQGLPPPAAPVLVGQQIYHFNYILSEAWKISNRLNSSPSSEDSESKCPEAISCLLLAAAGAEAFINETGYELSNKETTNTKADTKLAWALTFSEDSQIRTVAKYELALLMLTGDIPDRGKNPIQDLSTMFKIRNDLMHIKRPSSLSYIDQNLDTKAPSWVGILKDKGLFRILPTGHRTHWITQIMNPRFARWACETSTAAAETIAGKITAKQISKSLLELLSDSRHG